MDGIARQAQVSRSHLYYHFATKDVLFESLVECRSAQILAAKAEVFEAHGKESTGTEEERTAFLRGAIEHVMVPHRDFLRLLVTEAIRRSEIPPALIRMVDSLTRDVAVRLGRGAELAAEERARLLYLTIVPTLMAVILPADPTGALESPADIANLLLAEHTRLLTLAPPPASG